MLASASFGAHAHLEDKSHLVVGRFLVDDRLRLRHDLGVEQGKVAGVVFHGVLDDEDYPHVAEPGVRLEVDLVLEVFRHGEEYLRRAVPHEHALDGFLRFRFHPPEMGEVGVVVDEHQLVDVGVQPFDVTARGDGCFLVKSRHDDNEVEVFTSQLLQCRFLVRHRREAGEV